MEKFDVVIVGAGPSGIGMCSMLKDFGVESMTVIDKGCLLYTSPSPRD